MLNVDLYDFIDQLTHLNRFPQRIFTDIHGYLRIFVVAAIGMTGGCIGDDGFAPTEIPHLEYWFYVKISERMFMLSLKNSKRGHF